MRLTYEIQGSTTYLVYQVELDQKLDMAGVRMLTSNHIPGLAQAAFSQMDDERFIKYNISGRIASEQLFMGAIRKQSFLGVLSGIATAIVSAEEFLLDVNMFLLDMKYMFTDVSTGDTVLLCLPEEREGGQEVNVRDFIKKIMYNTAFDQSENCDYVAKLINYLNSSSAFSVEDFLTLLEQLRDEVPETRNETQPRVYHGESTGRKIEEKQRQSAEQPSEDECRYQEAYHRTQEGSAVSPPAVLAMKEPVSAPVEESAPSADVPDEPAMSLVYLLRHYTKENANIYKAQQDKKKNAKDTKLGKTGEKKEKKPEAIKKEKKPTKEKAAVPSVGFAVPGMEQPGGDYASPNAEQLREKAQQSQRKSAPEPQLPAQPLPQRKQEAPAASGNVAQALKESAQDAMDQPRGSSYPTTGAPANYGATDFFDEGKDLAEEETELLGYGHCERQTVTPHLIRRKNNERIPIDKALFRMGRDTDFNDYAIVDNRFVGHSHCHITSDNGEYLIHDDNSKNHTKVNGEFVLPGQPVKLAHDYVVSVADEEFVFKLY